MSIKNDWKDNIGCFTAIFLLIAILIIEPVIIFGAGWFGGWILMKIVGAAVASGMNLLFDTSRFTPDIIPVVCGALAVIGSYFKSHQTNNN